MSNCGLIAGAFSSTSGKADITLTTNGDILYYNSGRQRLAVGDEGQVLTVSDADLPAWETASGAWVGTATSNLAMGNYNITATGVLVFTQGTATISSGSITTTKTMNMIDTEASASSDDLDVNAGSVMGNLLVYSSANSSRDITVKDDVGTGQRHILPSDFSLDSHYDTITFMHLYDDGRIEMLASSDNI